MNAEYKPRIDLEGRTRLETVIPLSTPYLVFLDPSDVCNFQCQFCPTGDRALVRKFRTPRLMDFDLFQDIVDDLAKMPEPIKTLRLYKDGEPLLNKHLPGMIRYAKTMGRFGEVDTTTNGSLLYAGLNRRLVDAGLDKIFISVNGVCREDYLTFSRYHLAFGPFVKAIRHFYKYRGSCKVYVKISGDHLSEEKKKRFLEIFGNISDRVFIEHTAPCWPGFDVPGVNSDRGIYDNEIRPVQVCPYIFYSTAINSDGTVSLCFLDWQHRHLIGDLREEGFARIWNGSTLRHLQQTHLLMERQNMPWCKACGQLAYGAPDTLDPYAKEILGGWKRREDDWTTQG